jgi:tetratricopeptide (TPR) repeat protein
MIDHRAAAITVDATLYSELSPVFTALAEQPEASHLCEALSLAEGFEFQLVVCETPRVGAALLLWLDTEVARRRGEPVSSMRLSPYPLAPWEAHGALTREQLAQLILEPLVSPPPGTAAETRMVFIDASPASSQEHEAWVWLFHRLNERRNLFANKLPGPLSICLPPELEVEFIRAAPDLWSIRSTALTIRGPAVQPVPTPSARHAEPFIPAPEVSAEELEQARRAAGAGHPAALRGLAILLSRQSEADVLKGEVGKALRTLVEEVLPLCEQLGDTALRATTLRSVARVHHIRGELDEALTLLREQVLLVYQKLGDVRERAITLGQIADILQDRGQLDEALRIRREEELPVYEKLGDVRSLLVGRANLALLYLQRNHEGDRQQATYLLQLALEKAEELRIPEAEQIRFILEQVEQSDT